MLPAALIILATLGPLADARRLQRSGLQHVRDDFFVDHAAGVDKEASHTVIFAVKQQNLDELERIFWEVSDPNSKEYGAFMTRQEVADLTTNLHSERVLTEYLSSMPDVQSVLRSTFGEYLTVTAPVAAWEREFETSFRYYDEVLPASIAEAEGGSPARRVLRAETYSLPEELEAHVDAVFNTVQLPLRRKLNAAPTAAEAAAAVAEVQRELTQGHHHHQHRQHGQKEQLQSGEETYKQPPTTSTAPGTTTVSTSSYFTPSSLLSYYGIPEPTAATIADITMSIMENEQYVSPTDLSSFQSSYGLTQQAFYRNYGGHVHAQPCIINSNMTVKQQNTAFAACDNANIATQYAMAVAPGATTTFWYHSSTVEDFFVGWMHDVVSLANPPLVHVVAHGTDETEITRESSNQFNTLAMKLGAIGGTIIAAAGDNGCNNMYQKCGYYPSYPSTSPYVTSVGATQGAENGGVEQYCSSNAGGVITSGGGFSEYNARPSYQNDVVGAYWTTCAGIPTCVPANGSTYSWTKYNMAGRAYPDVAMAGHSFQFVSGGQLFVTSTTSVPAAVLGGIVVLINAERVSTGKSTLGFINPTLYSASPSSFTTDLTVGTDNCVADTVTTTGTTSNACCPNGFNATVGWDPLSGLGAVTNYTAFAGIFPDVMNTRRQRSLLRKEVEVVASSSAFVWTAIKGGSVDVVRGVYATVRRAAQTIFPSLPRYFWRS